MKFISILLIIFALNIYSDAGIYKANWGNTDQTSSAKQIDLYRLASWQINGSESINSKTLPFYSDTEDTLVFFTEFEARIDSSTPPAFFSGNGFNGSAEITINNNLIGKLRNDSAPFSIKIPDGLLKQGKNSIRINIKRYTDLADGYPQFAQLFNEPYEIGISRPFYISFMPEKLITNWGYSLRQSNNDNIVNLHFKTNRDLINLLPRKDALNIESKVINSSGKILESRLFDYTPDKEINNEFSISDNDLWTTSNPENLKLVFSVKRFGQVLYSDTVRTGFRSAEMLKNRMWINGKDLNIYGINYYENLILKAGSTFLSDIQLHLSAIKKKGFNAVRFVSHIPDEKFLSTADTLGLMVFVDLPVKRFPEALFKQDYLLENLKTTVSATIERFAKHPSFTALGLGQEIYLSPSTQKFYFILNGFTPRPVPILTYLSPVPAKSQTIETATDFYMLDLYESINAKKGLIENFNAPFLLNGKTGFTKQESYLASSRDNFGMERRLLLKNEVTSTLSVFNMQGGFIDSFMDWIAQSPTHQTINNANPFLISNGLYDSTFTEYAWTSEFENNIWTYNDVEVLKPIKKDKSTNVFSITMFFGSLVFLFFYRRYPRFSENYRRSLKHPYGFYVDMRERRIIPVFNSFMVGVHNSLILATFTGSFIYFWNDSFLAEEIFRLLLPDPAIFEAFLKINHSTFLIIVVLFVLNFLHPITIGLLLKFFGLITRRNVRLRQALAIGLWSGSPFVFMLPLSLAAYHLLLNDQFVIQILIIFGLIVIWVHFRLINGIRVLTLAKFRTIFVLLFLFYILPLVIFGLFFSPQALWSDYLITLLNSHSIF
ncbi:MAG: hypothetical protein H6627_01345 [Calditrichae bacterium]|nr:hypothetical protein [Calditrichia bacterium]